MHDNKRINKVNLARSQNIKSISRKINCISVYKKQLKYEILKILFMFANCSKNNLMEIILNVLVMTNNHS